MKRYSIYTQSCNCNCGIILSCGAQHVGGEQTAETVFHDLFSSHLEIKNLTLHNFYINSTLSLFVLLCSSQSLLFNTSAKSCLLKMSTQFIDYYKKKD